MKKSRSVTAKKQKEKIMPKVNLFSTYGEWTWRVIILVGLALNLWLTQSFVTRKEFEGMTQANTATHLTIQTSVLDIAATMKILAANINKLDDHESRLRVVEQRQTDVLARIAILERYSDRQNANGRSQTP